MKVAALDRDLSRVGEETPPASCRAAKLAGDGQRQSEVAKHPEQPDEETCPGWPGRVSWRQPPVT